MHWPITDSLWHPNPVANNSHFAAQSRAEATTGRAHQRQAGIVNLPSCPDLYFGLLAPIWLPRPFDELMYNLPDIPPTNKTILANAQPRATCDLV